MSVKVILVDINPRMIEAWKETFEENPEVEVVQGSMLDQTVCAWVSPTNSRGSMDGGLDAVIKKHLGANIETTVQREILKTYNGVMPVGFATCVETGKTSMPKFLISTPTMASSSLDISDSLNVALACCAAFQAVHMQNAKSPGSIQSVALPGLGANTGKTPVQICADLMWTAYNMFRGKEFATFQEMRKALEEELGSLEAMGTKEPKTAPAVASTSSAKSNQVGANTSTNTNLNKKPPVKKDDDFDDH